MARIVIGGYIHQASGEASARQTIVMEPQVSVIIPTFNRRLMLRDAIASVLAQREVALELIIVDDGSTDGTWDDLHRGELAQTLSCATDRCGIVTDRSVMRGGPAAARNRGAALSSAGYIAFLDSDDVWAPQKLRRQLSYMLAHPEYLLTQTRESWIRNGRRVNPGLRHLKRCGDIFEPSLRTCLVSPSAVMMRTQLFHDAGGFDEQMPACEDYDLWLRILCRHHAGLLDEALVTRRAGHSDQLSAITPALDRFRIRALLKLLASTDLTLRQAAAVIEVLAEKCSIYANGLRRRRRLEEFQFYSALGDNARALLDGVMEIGPDYWGAALATQPISVETV